MGAADVVPGVSGGTMAFILGIYEELIDSIRSFGRGEFLSALLRGRFPAAWRAVNGRFLVALAAGIGTAIVVLAHLIVSLLESHGVYVWSFFFGLIVASIAVVGRRIDRWRPALLGALAAGTAFAYGIVGLVPVQTPETWWFLVASGAIASCAMILPGVSGAFLLVLLGKYRFVLDAVKTIDVATIACVGIGATLGIITFAQILGWLFRRYHDLVVTLLVGLMLGSLRKIWPWKEATEWLRDDSGAIVEISGGQRVPLGETNVLPPMGTTAEWLTVAGATALALLGCGLVLLLERSARTGDPSVAPGS